ncbi:MAG: hypothetical protein R3240_04525 [Gammaproteobacteria bacterium]|nr:hypothetical protein [Gammaproteobacteria bacterium]
MSRQARMLLFLLVLIFIFPNGFCQANEIGESVLIQGVYDKDVSAGGGQVEVRAKVNGDILVFGGEVEIDSEVSADVMAIGGELVVSGIIGDDVRIAGGNITIDGQISDEVLIAGGEIHITPNSQIGGRVQIAGGDIEISGNVAGPLNVVGGKIVLLGKVRGDVELEGGEIEIGENALIEGNLIYRSHDEIKIHPNAQILGTVTRKPARMHTEDTGFGYIVFPLAMMVAGITLLLLFPSYTITAAQSIAVEPLKCMGLGLATLVTTPFASFILITTVLGLWVGLPLLAFYFVALLVAMLIAAFYVGDMGAKLFKKDLERRSRRIVSLIVAIVVMSIVYAIPIIGGLIAFVLLLLALGAAVMQLYRNYNATATPK